MPKKLHIIKWVLIRVITVRKRNSNPRFLYRIQSLGLVEFFLTQYAIYTRDEKRRRGLATESGVEVGSISAIGQIDSL